MTFPKKYEVPGLDDAWWPLLFMEVIQRILQAFCVCRDCKVIGTVPDGVSFFLFQTIRIMQGLQSEIRLIFITK